MKFYIIGEREMVLAFRLTGIEGTIAESRRQVLDAFNRATGKGGENAVPLEQVPKVLILTQRAVSHIQEEEIAWQKTGKYPLIVEIPGLDGHMPGRKSLSDSIREAIGVKV